MYPTSVLSITRLGRLVIFVMALAVAFVAMKVLNLGEKLHPLVVFEVIGIGFLLFLAGFKNSLEKPIIPFLGLMMTLFLIFVEKKYFRILGLDLKLYILMFGLASTLAGYHIVTNFSHLWRNYVVFRMLFVFFIINCIYLLLGYYSDFRLSTDLMSMRYASAQASGATSMSSQQGREFGAFAQYVLHIDTLVPLVSATIGLMLFGIPNSKTKDTSILHSVILLFSASVALHYILALIAPVLGTSPGLTSIAGDVDPGSNFILPMWLFILIGFKYYLFSIRNHFKLPWHNALVNFGIIYTLILIASIPDEGGGSSSMRVALLSGLVITFVILRYLKLDLPISNIEKLKKSKSLAFLLIVLFLGIFLGGMYILAAKLGNASTGDASSFNMRLSHWRDIMTVWYSRLSPMTLLFGYGLDKVLETVYYMSMSSTEEKGIQSPHNVYIGMIFNYGLMSLPFFGAIFIPILSSVRYLKNKSKPLIIKLFSGADIAIIVSIGLMWLFLDMTLIVKIIYFATLGFLESLKRANLDESELEALNPSS